MRGSRVLKNSSIGLISQIVTVIFTFITRSLFIKCVGIELLGINSTFASIFSTLSLGELGFQSAVVFSLYKPLHEGDKDSITAYMNVLRFVYFVVGILFIIATALSLPFLTFILSEIEVDTDIYIYFILQSLISVSTYFFAYKRAIVYADQKDYVSRSIDMFCNIFFSIIQCIILVIVKNYTCYLMIKIIQVITSNALVNSYCKKKLSIFDKK